MVGPHGNCGLIGMRDHTSTTRTSLTWTHWWTLGGHNKNPTVAGKSIDLRLA